MDPIWAGIEKTLNEPLSSAGLKIKPLIYGERHDTDQFASVSNISTNNTQLKNVRLYEAFFKIVYNFAYPIYLLAI